MLPLKNTPLTTQCSNFCTLPKGRRKQHLCFLLIPVSFSFLQKSSPPSFADFLQSSFQYHWKLLLSKKIQPRLAGELQRAICHRLIFHPRQGLQTEHKSATGNSPTHPLQCGQGLQQSMHTATIHTQIKSHNHNSSNQQVMEQHLIFSQLNYSRFPLSYNLWSCITSPTLHVRK